MYLETSLWSPLIYTGKVPVGVDIDDYVDACNFNLYVCFQLQEVFYSEDNFSFVLYKIPIYISFYILRFILLLLEVLYHLNAFPFVSILRNCNLLLLFFLFIYFKHIVKVHISFNFVFYIRILLIIY